MFTWFDMNISERDYYYNDGFSEKGIRGLFS